MFALSLRLFAAAIALYAGAVLAAPSVVDGRGEVIHLTAPASRVVSLAPHLTELLFVIGAGDRVVGTVAHSDYPEAARSIPVVGDYARLDLERISALHPDLVVAWWGGNSPRGLAQIAALGIPVYAAASPILDAIAEQIEVLGRLVGRSDAAQAEAARFRYRLDRLRRTYGGRRPVSVFYQISHQPLITVGGPDFINDVITVCGGRNIFAKLAVPAPEVSLEAVLAADPEAIIAGTDRPPEVLKAQWRRWDGLRAVRMSHLYTVPPDLIHRPTPRILDGASRLCQDLDRIRGGPGH